MSDDSSGGELHNQNGRSIVGQLNTRREPQTLHESFCLVQIHIESDDSSRSVWFQHHSGPLILVMSGRGNGNIEDNAAVGSTALIKSEMSHESRANLIWREKTLHSKTLLILTIKADLMQTQIGVDEVEIARTIDTNAQWATAERCIPVLGAAQLVGDLHNSGGISGFKIASIDSAAHCSGVEIVLVDYQRTWTH